MQGLSNKCVIGRSPSALRKLPLGQLERIQKIAFDLQVTQQPHLFVLFNSYVAPDGYNYAYYGVK